MIAKAWEPGDHVVVIGHYRKGGRGIVHKINNAGNVVLDLARYPMSATFRPEELAVDEGADDDDE